MHSTLSYFLVAGFGALLAFILTLPMELRRLRLFQMMVFPALFLVIFRCMPSEGLPSAGGGMLTLFLIVGLGIVLTPNLSHFFSVRVSNFLDPMDWAPAEEEMALRPIRRLIEENQNREALTHLEKLLQKHKPTYEALLIKAKLLYHIGSVSDTAVTLHKLIPLSNTTEQQLVVMQLLSSVEQHHSPATRPPAAGRRRVTIEHELLLFVPVGNDRLSHKAIPPGTYDVEEILHDNTVWLKLAREDWGNSESCWAAALGTSARSISRAPQKTGLVHRLANRIEAINAAIHPKPRIRRQAEGRGYFKQAAQYIREDNWQEALPLLQKASACDPDCYEFAYRWAQAVQHTANSLATSEIVAKILAQSQWTASEQQMLQQLKRPISSHPG